MNPSVTVMRGVERVQLRDKGISSKPSFSLARVAGVQILPNSALSFRELNAKLSPVRGSY